MKDYHEEDEKIRNRVNCVVHVAFCAVGAGLLKADWDVIKL